MKSFKDLRVIIGAHLNKHSTLDFIGTVASRKDVLLDSPSTLPTQLLLVSQIPSAKGGRLRFR